LKPKIQKRKMSLVPSWAAVLTAVQPALDALGVPAAMFTLTPIPDADLPWHTTVQCAQVVPRSFH
jgi:hypothetical protein